MKNTWTTELEEMSNYTLVIVSETFIPWRARWCFTFPFSLSFSPKQLQIYHHPVTTSEVLFSSPHFFLPSDWKSSEWTLFIALGCFLMIKLFGIIHPANFFFFLNVLLRGLIYLRLESGVIIFSCFNWKFLVASYSPSSLSLSLSQD